MSLATLRTLRGRVAAYRWPTLALRAALLVAGWWILTEGAPGGLVPGALVVSAALIASVSLPSPRPPRWHLRGLVQLAWIFIAGSIRGGFDVARRALAPRLPIAPYVTHHALRLPEGPVRSLLAGTLSLMPGTMVIASERSTLELHVLAPHDRLGDDLARLEAAIARATGEYLEEPRA